jgi:hypothetical protein
LAQVERQPTAAQVITAQIVFLQPLHLLAEAEAVKLQLLQAPVKMAVLVVAVLTVPHRVVPVVLALLVKVLLVLGHQTAAKLVVVVAVPPKHPQQRQVSATLVVMACLPQLQVLLLSVLAAVAPVV